MKAAAIFGVILVALTIPAQADPVRGTGHLRTPLARGEAIMARLQGRLTGIATWVS